MDRCRTRYSSLTGIVHTYKTVGWVLSSFFYGYIFTQIPGGWIATRFGGKYVFGVGVLVTSVLTLITPQMAYINLWALVAVRVIIGFFEVSKYMLL